MRTGSLVAGFLLAALCASRAFSAGSAIIGLTVSVAGQQTTTDFGGNFAITGVKAGTYDVSLSGNPVKSYSTVDDGHHLFLKVNGKRYPVVCSPEECTGKGVPIKDNASGNVTLAD